MPRLVTTHSRLCASSLHLIEEQQLLDTRICDLPLELERPWIKRNINRLNIELAAKGLRFRPYIWISDDWFTPDGVSGFAIPFFILHPRLIGIEKRMMGEAEGSTSQWCMKLFRHETGHALDNAFHLRKNKRRQALFGLTSIEYPDSYLPDPKSKDHVQHLEDYYAQAHPDEDWAESFAIWLDPRSAWKTRYRNWPALNKLEFIDELLDAIQGQPPVNNTKTEIGSFKTNKMTLREYYRIKRIRYGRNIAPKFKSNLKKIFPKQGEIPAWKFINTHQKFIAKNVAKQTQIKLKKVKRMVRKVEKTCRKEKLHITENGLQDLKREELIELLMNNTSRFNNKKSPRILM